MTDHNDDIRWRQRFENFEKAYLLLSTVMDKDLDTMPDIEKEGYIQRLEMTYELAWKTMKDYLEYQGLGPDLNAPRGIIREAFAAGLITDGKLWIRMAEDRNLMAHTYNEEYFRTVIGKLKTEYIPAIRQLYDWLKTKAEEE